MNTNYRKYKAGDIVEVTGLNGSLYNSYTELRLSDESNLTFFCKLVSDEDDDGDVLIPHGFFRDHEAYVHVSCIALVKPVEEIKHVAIIVHAEEHKCFVISSNDHHEKRIAILYYVDGITREQAEKFANDIKAAYDDMNK